MINEIIVSRILLTWLCLLFTAITIMNYYEDVKIGPSDSLIVFGTKINTTQKYISVVLLCICNSSFRVLNVNIISAWVINNIQDTKLYFKVNTFQAYEITSVHALYGFVDLYFFVNIVTSQVDLFAIELFVDLIMALITTGYYLNIKVQAHANLITQSEEIKNYILTGQIDFDA